MHKKTIFMTVSVFMALSLVMAACAPAATPVTPTAPATPAIPATPTPATPTTPAVEKPKQEAVSSDKPQYGGTINLLQTTDLVPSALSYFFPDLSLVHEHFLQQDWTKGPGGTGDISMEEYFAPLEFTIGQVAESWEIPSIDTWKFTIRRGIRYALDPNNQASRLVNGRELTTDDVVWSVRRMLDKTVAIQTPKLYATATVEKTGPQEVTIKGPGEPWWGAISFVYGYAFCILPADTSQQFDPLNWRNGVGSGPYMMTDLIPASAVTFTRNPNYWQKNPVGPGKGDQLPYVETVRALIITDASTRLAAVRTGRLDWVNFIPSEDARSLMKTTPTLKYLKTSVGSNARGLYMRTDDPKLPFQDIRVRQALMMATDFESFKNELYQGDAYYPTGPVPPGKGTEDIYMTVDQLPASVQTLYKYNPQKAKQLLAEAGYPNGFKANIIVQSVLNYVDVLSVVKDEWSKVGVTLEIQPKETGTFNSIQSAGNYEQMLFSTVWSGPYAIPAMQGYRGAFTSSQNQSHLNDPKIEAAAAEMAKYIGIDMPKLFQIGRDMIPYLLGQAYFIQLPQPYTYRMWQPWVKNYHGEQTLNWATGNNFVQYAWIDQALKTSLGH